MHERTMNAALGAFVVALLLQLPLAAQTGRKTKIARGRSKPVPFTARYTAPRVGPQSIKRLTASSFCG